MKKPSFKYVLAIFVSVFFLAATLASAFPICDMDAPSASQVKMAEMDCHKTQNSVPETPKEQASCCLDMGCYKCFSSPIIISRTDQVKEPILSSMPLFIAVSHIYSYNPNLLDRPPKNA